MSDGAKTGQCLCGAVKYTAYGPKDELHACHCPTCQKWAGGVFVGLEVERLDVPESEALGVFKSSEWAERLYCTACGTNLAWRLQDGGMPIVTAASLDEPAKAELTLEYYIDTKPDGYALAGDHKRLTRQEVEALFGGDGG